MLGLLYRLYNSWITKTRCGVAWRHIRDNSEMKKAMTSGNVVSESAACTFRDMTPARSAAFIAGCFDYVKRFTGMMGFDLRDKRCLEVGCGENVALALRLISEGAAHVTCVDRFFAERDRTHEAAIYMEMRRHLDKERRSRFDEAISLGPDGHNICPERVTCHYGVDIAKSQEIFSPGSFDLIYSNAVLEHVRDPEKALIAMDKLLALGGIIVHSIDCKDHGMLSSLGFHPLTFLTIPDSIYHLMSSHSALPNRRFARFYRDQMARLGYEWKIYVTQVIDGGKASGRTSFRVSEQLANCRVDENTGVVTLCEYKEDLEKDVDYGDFHLDLVRSIRPRLAYQFKALRDDELLEAAFILVARKKG